MSFTELLLSPFGRVNRKTFWLVCPLCCLPGVVFAYLDDLGIEALYSNSLVIYLGILGLCLNWPFYTIQIKRWHDRNKSGWWCLINFIPLIGPIWSLIELGFLKGTSVPNHFGEPQQIVKNTELTSLTIIKTLLVVFGVCISGLMYLYQDHVVLRVLAYIAGIVLVLLWLKYLSVGRIFSQMYGPVPCLTVWQFNILPTLTAVCLSLTGNIVFLPLMVVFWFLPNFLAVIFRNSSFQLHVPYFMSIVYGWYIGVSFGGLFNVTSSFWKVGSGILGILIIQVICSLIFNYITGLDDKAEHMGGD